MSLINDALKRASSTFKKRPTDGTGDPPLLSADSSTSRNTVSMMLVPLAAVVLLAVAGWFLWNGWKPKSTPQKTTVKTVALRRTSATANATNHPSASAAVTPPVSNTTALAAMPSPSSPSSIAPPATPEAPDSQDDADNAATTPPPPVFPALKLEGIAFRPTKSSAIINGQILYVGDAWHGVRVVAIDRQTVTVDLDGQRKVLTMP
ncbi:MAG: hypothetical protein M1608_14840 [Candidatus Omnitrophica bacterium]|nr:hypothetical protein [Candidatus Omnitrophota bacterium]